MQGECYRLFGEQLTPVVSPWLLKSGPVLQKPADVAQFALIEAGDAHHTHLEWLTWRRWFDEHGLQKLQPQRPTRIASGVMLLCSRICTAPQWQEPAKSVTAPPAWRGSR